ncbi:3-oxoacyl-[acyl-carrier-protein] synthase 3 [Candidatus Hepatincola sp. Av]
MFAKIIATGSYLPKKILTNNDLAKTVDTTDEWIVSRTGIKQRHIAAESETSSDLALAASKQCLNSAKLTEKDLDAIIVCTTTPDLTFPSTATILQSKLGMKHGYAFDVQAVCSGFIYGLSVADSLITSGKAKRILLVGTEVFSKIVNWKDRNTCVLFGDGAGAVILEATKEDPKNGSAGILATELRSNGDYGCHLQTTGGPSSTATVGYITMNGGEVFKHAVINMASLATEILQKNNLTKSDIDYLVPHQANIRILKSMANKLSLPIEKVIITLDQHANTSAASIPLALDYAIKNNKVKAGDLILSEAMGAGFTWGAAIFRL